MVSKRFLITLFLASYLIISMASMPIHLIWGWASPYAGSLPVQVSELEGTLWHGKAKLSYQKQQFSLKWTIRITDFLLGKLSLPVTIAHPALNLQTEVWVSAFGNIGIKQSTGYVDDQLLTLFQLPNGTLIAGRLWIDQLSMNASLNGEIELIQGEARWSGGKAIIPAGRNKLTVQVPQLNAVITTVDKIELRVTDESSGEWIYGDLDNEGWATLQMKQHAADALDLPLSSGSRNVLFEVKQKLY